jgi:two-component system OmpR family response regulator
MAALVNVPAGVLVVEDDPTVREVVVRYLEREGLSVEAVADGETALASAGAAWPDLVVLDLMLPRLHGERVLGAVRAQGRNVPVLVLTARDLVADRVRLLDAGADDYLIKPFDPAELVSRCRALVRRAAGHRSPVITIGDVEIDTARRMATRDGHPVAVTPREFRVIEYLALNRGRVVSRDELLAHLYDDAEETWSNVLEVYVAGLRRKLGPDIIQTRRGHGYYVDA